MNLTKEEIVAYDTEIISSCLSGADGIVSHYDEDNHHLFIVWYDGDWVGQTINDALNDWCFNLAAWDAELAKKIIVVSRLEI